MMEAANRGAKEEGRSIALGISLPFEQGELTHLPIQIYFEFHYFFLRKFYFLYHAKAIVGFSGFGTMDELLKHLHLLKPINCTKNACFSIWKRILGWD